MSSSGSETIPTVRCAHCAQVWLVPGLRPGGRHACKGCGRLLTVSGRLTQPVVGARNGKTEVSAPGSKRGKDEYEKLSG